MANNTKTTKVIDTDYQKLTVVGLQMIQVQIEQDGQEAYIDLSRNEARLLAKTLIQHCDEAENKLNK